MGFLFYVIFPYLAGNEQHTENNFSLKYHILIVLFKGKGNVVEESKVEEK